MNHCLISTRHFLSIISQTTKILETAKSVTHEDTSAGVCTRSFGFTIDMGVIPPLHFTALKCRVRHIRRQATDLLATACYQEGVWDGTLASIIAREVMRIEEKDLCNVQMIEDAPSCGSSTGDPQLALTVFHACKLYDVGVEIPDVPNENMKITCTRKRLDGS